MRQMIKGLVAAFAVTVAGAAPAMACGYSPCAGTYYAPTYSYEPAYAAPAYTGCGVCGAATAWGYEQLAEPSTQYYYVNQGPVYSGPGAFAPEPVYQEDAAPTYYGYRHHYHPYAHHYGWRHYGYAHHYRYFPHNWGYRYGGGEGTYWGHHLVRRYY